MNFLDPMGMGMGMETILKNGYGYGYGSTRPTPIPSSLQGGKQIEANSHFAFYYIKIKRFSLADFKKMWIMASGIKRTQNRAC